MGHELPQGLSPTELFRERILCCFINDRVGVKLLDEFNVDNVCWESDYPHSDSSWPNAPGERRSSCRRPRRRPCAQDHARERDAALPVRSVRDPAEGAVHRRRAAGRGRDVDTVTHVGLPRVTRVGLGYVHLGFGGDEREALAIAEWLGASPTYTLRMQRALGFAGGDDVPTIYKGLQLDCGFTHQYMDVAYDLQSETYGEFWLNSCGALLDVEPMGRTSWSRCATTSRTRRSTAPRSRRTRAPASGPSTGRRARPPGGHRTATGP